VAEDDVVLALIVDPVSTLATAAGVMEASGTVRPTEVEWCRLGVVSAAADCGIDEGISAIVMPSSEQSLLASDAGYMSGIPFETLQSSHLHRQQVNSQCLQSKKVTKHCQCSFE
jgi:hypothetical protein